MVGLGLADPVVHPLRVRQERVPRGIACGQLPPLQLSGPQKSKLELETVGVEGDLAHDLRKPARSLPPHEIHLEQAELRVHVTCGEEQVVVGLGGDVRRAVLLEHNTHRLLEAIEAEHAVGHLGVGGHRPRARRRVERRPESGQTGDGDERHVKDGGRNEQRAGEVGDVAGGRPADRDARAWERRTRARRFPLLEGGRLDGGVDGHGRKSALTLRFLLWKLPLCRAAQAQLRPPGRRGWSCRPAAGSRTRRGEGGA